MFKKVILLFISISFMLSQNETKLKTIWKEIPSFNAEIKRPDQFFGHKIGERHLTTSKIVAYLKYLETKTDRLVIEEMGNGHTGEKTYLATFTTKTNRDRVQTLKDQRKEFLSKEIGNFPINDLMVVWMGYSIHGNEASGANSVPLVVYALAAGEGEWINKLLTETVVLIDPFLNPDGLNRFANFVNTFRGKVANPDPSHIEHQESWPNGRTNYYWFDLNRDWLPTVHPESQGRIRKFYEWMPNILTDFHEMGTNSTFFFQPGIPSRNNPLTPKKVYDLTQKMGDFHAAALDDIGSLYYSKESFDDFYYGKGSTYPDVNGAVGILFEQASARGHIQSSQHGNVSLAFAAHNQLTASYSTFRSALALKDEFLNHQRNFYNESSKLADKDKVKGYQLDFSEKMLMLKFKRILRRHRIKMFVNKNDKLSLIIPKKQNQYRLITSMFEKRKSFTDSLFYDVSTWNLAAAFNADLSELSQSKLKKVRGEAVNVNSVEGLNSYSEKSKFYAFSWSQFYAPKLAYELQKMGIKIKAAKEKFSINSSSKKMNFFPGDVIIPILTAEKNREKVIELLEKFRKDYSMDIYGFETGATLSGPYLGSSNFRIIPKIKPLVLVGNPTSSYSAGELWHLLDNVFEIPVTLGRIENINRLGLGKYSSVIVPEGNYNSLDSNKVKLLKKYVSSGGNLILLNQAIDLAVKYKWSKDFKMKKPFKVNKDSNLVRYNFDEYSQRRGASVIGGSIFNVKMDLSHPLAYGYRNPNLTVFRQGTRFMELTKNPYYSPFTYTTKPLFSGYINKNNYNDLKNSAAINVIQIGSGRAFAIPDRLYFRGFFLGSSKVLMNAIIYGKFVSKME